MFKGVRAGRHQKQSDLLDVVEDLAADVQPDNVLNGLAPGLGAGGFLSVAFQEGHAGKGDRLHTHDPRRDALWRLAKRTGAAGDCVALSKIVGDAFKAVRGMTLPINVDGVIGAIVADMNLAPRVAKAIFIFGRIAGLAAHYFEEIATQPPMRRIDFAQAVYTGG